MTRNNLIKYGLTVLTASTALIGAGGTAQAQDNKKPNILVIWGDDIGIDNVSAHMWIFVPLEQKLKEFLVSLPQYPFQAGLNMNPANLNYNTLKVAGALRQLESMQQIGDPND